MRAVVGIIQRGRWRRIVGVIIVSTRGRVGITVVTSRSRGRIVVTSR